MAAKSHNKTYTTNGTKKKKNTPDIHYKYDEKANVTSSLSTMLDGSDNAGSGRNACLSDKLNISTAYPWALGILLVHDFRWESPPTCLDSNALAPAVYDYKISSHPFSQTIGWFTILLLWSL